MPYYENEHSMYYIDNSFTKKQAKKALKEIDTIKKKYNISDDENIENNPFEERWKKFDEEIQKEFKKWNRIKEGR